MHNHSFIKKALRNLSLLCCVCLLASGRQPAAAGPGTSATPSLGDVLEQTTRRVEQFWQQFSSVTCTETVRQEKLGKQGKIEYQQQSIFDYLIFMTLEGDDLRIEESRLLQKSIGKSKNLPLLITSGFPTLLLVFHPYYQEDYRYQLDGTEQIQGGNLIRLRFEHVPGTRSTSALRLRGRDYPLDLQGTAWVNPQDGSIQKMTAGLAVPMDDLNLKALNVEVQYEPHQFPSSPGTEWLPSTATIDVETARQHWHNVHTFSNYKRFSVNSESTVSK
jgi:hypothetical protein